MRKSWDGKVVRRGPFSVSLEQVFCRIADCSMLRVDDAGDLRQIPGGRLDGGCGVAFRGYVYILQIIAINKVC